MVTTRHRQPRITGHAGSRAERPVLQAAGIAELDPATT
jgi:hypothetical protein